MKNFVKMALIISMLIGLNGSLFSQSAPPPPPPQGDGDSGPVGGSAPIGGGTLILIVLGSAYLIIKLKKESRLEK